MDDAVSLLPPEGDLLDMEDALFCYEYRVDNEDFISPWFDDEFAIFDYLEDVDEFLITRKYIRTSDGIQEDNGVGDLLDLEWVDLSECGEPAPEGVISAEDLIGEEG